MSKGEKLNWNEVIQSDEFKALSDRATPNSEGLAHDDECNDFFARSRRQTEAARISSGEGLVTDATERRIDELIAEGDGFWRPCSGCQESCDGAVSINDYPYSKAFKCQPGGGCGECGGIGVIWDTTDYANMARATLQAQTSEIERRLAAVREVVERKSQWSADYNKALDAVGKALND